jgi:nucleoid-associated protein YgaU
MRATTSRPSPSSSAATGSLWTKTADTYVTKAGDTLSGIAERLYGDGSLWRKIYDANKMVIGPDPDKLGFDLTLKIPLPG